jgi:hypothetical protein
MGLREELLLFAALGAEHYDNDLLDRRTSEYQ